jgi:hypothetical protein
MKTDLTTTNFKLGDEKDRTEYETTNKTAMNHILTHPMDKSEREEKAAMNKALKEAVKKSSLDFGNEATIYESVMSVDMRKATQGGTSEYARRKQEISDMTASLRKHNFTLGDESKGSNKVYIYKRSVRLFCCICMFISLMQYWLNLSALFIYLDHRFCLKHHHYH